VTMAASTRTELFPSLKQLRDGLSGPRIRVRLWRPDDAPALFAAIEASRAHLRPWMDWVDRHQSIDDSLEYITRATLELTQRESIALGIFDAIDDATVLGATGLHNIDWTVPAFEIGYWADVNAHGHGYIGEAVRLVTAFALRTLEANRIALHCDPNNVRSRNVAERNGFRLEGRLRNMARTPFGTLRDTLVYARVPTDTDGR
jgi:RimJ/RimL family protein N-acetyltransferase